MISHSEQLIWQLLSPYPSPGIDFWQKICVQKRFSYRRSLCLGKGSSCSSSCGLSVSSVATSGGDTVYKAKLQDLTRGFENTIGSTVPSHKALYFLFRLSVCVAKSESNCSCPTFMIWIARRFGFWLGYLKLMCCLFSRRIQCQFSMGAHQGTSMFFIQLFCVGIIVQGELE